ncbi:TfoX/Sxy family DNA transformation protein [Paenibacillus alkalitolerans]|uniref:TfoX/Sxy family DNA transformation protein n=1 Tax=Paenibacillus alkalitolerans TaxID=2799335 RepID=UPI0018F4A7F3|nr:TfoX/Sxy family DNA transformation protein [Paenibacillus alkalitolerans]
MRTKKTMNLKNIGAKTESWLQEIGVHGYDDLNRIGSVETYRRLKSRYPDQVNLTALYALEAALWSIHWLELAPEIKDQLKREVLSD